MDFKGLAVLIKKCRDCGVTELLLKSDGEVSVKFGSSEESEVEHTVEDRWEPVFIDHGESVPNHFPKHMVTSEVSESDDEPLDATPDEVDEDDLDELHLTNPSAWEEAALRGWLTNAQ